MHADLDSGGAAVVIDEVCERLRTGLAKVGSSKYSFRLAGEQLRVAIRLRVGES